MAIRENEIMFAVIASLVFGWLDGVSSRDYQLVLAVKRNGQKL